jgi:hypothetical protein
MRLVVALINFRTPELTLSALEAALPAVARIEGSKVVLLDNDSGDGSFEWLTEQVHRRALTPVEVWRSDRNGGFAYGVNWIARRVFASSAPPEYLYLLNSDAFPAPDAIEELVDFLDRNPEAGIAGSYIHGPDGEPHHTAFRFPSVSSELEATLAFGPVSRLLERSQVALTPIPSHTTRVDWLAGASMMIRRSVFEAAGYFDERYFLYYEETDFCRRAAQLGWAAYYVPASKVAHIGSASTGMKNKTRRTPGYWFDSRRHYFRKNHGPRYLWAANLAWLFGFTVRRARVRWQGKPDLDRPRLWSDFVRHNFLGGGRA